MTALAVSQQETTSLHNNSPFDACKYRNHPAKPSFNAKSMLGQRRRRWPNIDQALKQRLVLGEFSAENH